MRILSILSGGDRRSIGRVDDVVAFVLGHPEQLPVLIEGMGSENDVIRMRCADAAEKISLQEPEWLKPFRKELMRIGLQSTQQEVRWHIAQILPRLGLVPPDREAAVLMLLDYLDDRSRIVTTSSMSALAEFARDDPSLCKKLIPMLQRFVAQGSPAERSRARKLLSEPALGVRS